MGDISKILNKEKLDTTPLFENKIRMEASESFHFHWRDGRILMTPKQADAFINSAITVGRDWDGELYSETDLVLENSDIPEEILFCNEAKIELLKDGNIHFHWRDLRLELVPKDFITLCNLFLDAKKEYLEEE